MEKIIGGAFAIVGVLGMAVFVWSLGEAASQADDAVEDWYAKRMAELEEEAAAYERAESMGRDLPPAA